MNMIRKLPVALFISAFLLIGALLGAAGANAEDSCAQAAVGNDATAAQYCPIVGIQTLGGEVGGKKAGGTSHLINGSNQDTYGGTTAVTADTVADINADSAGSSLPFTGLDIGVLVAVAAGLLGVGLVLSRLSQPRENANS